MNALPLKDSISPDREWVMYRDTAEPASIYFFALPKKVEQAVLPSPDEVLGDLGRKQQLHLHKSMHQAIRALETEPAIAQLLGPSWPAYMRVVARIERNLSPNCQMRVQRQQSHLDNLVKDFMTREPSGNPGRRQHAMEIAAGIRNVLTSLADDRARGKRFQEMKALFCDHVPKALSAPQ